MHIKYTVNNMTFQIQTQPVILIRIIIKLA